MTARVATFDQLDAIPFEAGFVWHPIRRRFDIRAFGTNAYTAEAVGRQIVEDHTEGNGHEEVYVVVRGRARFSLGGEEVDAPAGTIVFVRDHTLRRGAVAEEEGTLVLAVGGFPDKAFEISPWEALFAATPLVREERWDEVISLYREALRERPGHPALLYNLARAEARARRHLDALLDLEDAIARDPSLAALARHESDFAALQREPAFPG